MSYTQKKMNLFDAPKGAILVHACNTKGIWGSGIAVEFKKRFPIAYHQYAEHCRIMGLVGTAPVIATPNKENAEFWVGCLLTSRGFASTLDSKEDILVNTTLALESFCKTLWMWNMQDVPIYSNRFNSGLFKVPWHETERILRVFVKRYSLNWTVCDL